MFGRLVSRQRNLKLTVLLYVLEEAVTEMLNIINDVHELKLCALSV